MDPITAAALTALAGSVGGDAGRQAWQGLNTLVRRPFRRGSAEDAQTEGSPGISSGELEVAELENNPGDPVRAQALATALGVRAALDGEFRASLAEWWQEAQSGSSHEVHNSISGGTQNGPVLQGRDFSSLTFNMSRDDDR
ncbi:hypothetical protein [Streptomyces sp. ITFR-16]|uniref:hypothetical protein n=1 Tax=Streptomyces sp. ITFR-16 TaxID=3075198 RepID=UPI0028897AFD|nr:hypothetical protein [Streptomyces sp. ITFR-16]WNI24190.1 hypothetical protein RLT58_20770 [Streptomyces sp. ITFR-16]